MLMSQSDARLAQLAAQGHDRAFEAIVERYRRPLGRYLRRSLPPALAEDVLQASFVRAWQALQGGAEVRDLRAWLYRIAHNQAGNALRAGGEPRLPEAAPAPGPEDELQRREELLATLHDIDALPARQRTALRAVAVADRPHADVARELGLSEGGLRQLLLRARTALRATATALTPPPIAAWLAGGQGYTAARVSELAAGAGGAGVAVKVGTAVLATSALVGGVGTITHELGSAPAGHVATGHELGSAPAGYVTTRPAASAPSGAAARSTPTQARPPADRAAASRPAADQRAQRRKRSRPTTASSPVDSRSQARATLADDRGADAVTSGQPPAPAASVDGHVSKTAPKASPRSTKPNTAKPARQTKAAQTPKAPPGLPKRSSKAPGLTNGSSKAMKGEPEAPKSNGSLSKTSAQAGAAAPGAPHSHGSSAAEDRSSDDGSRRSA